MKCTKEERQAIRRRVYEHKLVRLQAADEYETHKHTAKWHLRCYRDTNELPLQKGKASTGQIIKAVTSKLEDIGLLANDEK